MRPTPHSIARDTNQTPPRSRPGLRLDANGHHLPKPGAELVAESRPRNPRVGIGVGCRLAVIELSRKVSGHRRRRRRVKTIPETAHERDAFLGSKGFEGW